ncbi:nucleotidyltransferase (plasmid) [Deinococcus metallilatus]|uniref:Cyclic GMP-AMP synthase n=1 Tax=Deinococcus metallilatus TaxID=1211322 RepID=A0AAJ5JZH7_9DEIO|nr:nucleotidyltransferase [Deinococcus metallilatus]MBB5293757.1 hypothetical protein [Deinococcus metallilatus]QBY07280.1 nucleotidyltransferase [Deinococcus metallilatus]RXJ14753.1 nucleotidyltransferase [Deinococcus metallilatus]TLK30873.1 nucleotidyltransferase [Deinococcus metallilatus]GMA17686.1 hypothetical protein GCM10025871_40170 [Deinococcus metallilatus]
MAKVQKQFYEFDKEIQLGTTEEEPTLRERREQVLDALRSGLKKLFEDKDESAPSFKKFDQGSYSLKTGVKPIDEQHDYDIDVGAVFNIDSTQGDYKDDPTKIKRLIRDALDLELDEGTVEIKTPCVTVTFDDGCHVDLAAYADPDMRTDIELPLARGKEFAGSPEWQTNHPSELARRIRTTFSIKEERQQFKRVLRALKRWRDHKYRSATSHASPVGVGLTVAGLTMFTPQGRELYGTTDDRAALQNFVQNLLDTFQDNMKGDKDDELGRRLVVELPFAPYTDVFARMTNRNMEIFEDRLIDLRDALRDAGDAGKNTDACKVLQGQFKGFPDGEDEEEEGTKDSVKKAAAILTPSISG